LAIEVGKWPNGFLGGVVPSTSRDESSDVVVPLTVDRFCADLYLHVSWGTEAKGGKVRMVAYLAVLYIVVNARAIPIETPRVLLVRLVCC